MSFLPSNLSQIYFFQRVDQYFTFYSNLNNEWQGWLYTLKVFADLFHHMSSYILYIQKTMMNKRKPWVDFRFTPTRIRAEERDPLA